MDFREFLCSLSVLTRGGILQKFDLFFNVFDVNKKMYIQKEDFFWLVS